MIMSFIRSLVAVALVSVVAGFTDPQVLAQSPPATPPLHAYVSTPDNQWDARYQPLDSVATVSAMFERYATVQGVSRVYWRGARAEAVLNHYDLRRQGPQRYDFWTDWQHHLYRDLRLNQVAEREAHRHGMQIYAMEALFDYGGPGDAEYPNALPYFGGDRLLRDHPEWSPVDRWGERRQPGPIEFVYPAARRAVVERFTAQVVDGNYDGLFLYTYFENFSTRFEDEFGFNEPIVTEYARRYGVDIRKEPFDRQRWADLRGEYVTELLGELHRSLAARGKRLTVALTARNPDRIQDWPLNTGQINTMVRLDWRKWAQRGIVDEIAIMGGTDVEAIALADQVLALRTDVELTIFTESPAHPRFAALVAKGVTLTGYTAPYRGHMERYSSAPATAAGLTSSHWTMRVHTVAAVTDGTLVVEPHLLMPVLADPHVLVRREAIRALVKLKATAFKASIEAALKDPEESVRVAAMIALATLGDPTSAPAIRRALRGPSRFMVKEAAIVTLTAYGRAVMPDVVDALSSPVLNERQVAIRALGRMVAAQDRETVINVAQSDPDDAIRYYAVEALPRIGHMALSLAAAAGDRSEFVQIGAVATLATGVRSLSASDVRNAVEILQGLFQRYGANSKRTDADWGWRVVGRTLLAVGGDAGRQALEHLRDQRADLLLARRAYLALHVPQNSSAYVVSNRDEDERVHKRYAP